MRACLPAILALALGSGAAAAARAQQETFAEPDPSGERAEKEQTTPPIQSAPDTLTAPMPAHDLFPVAIHTTPSYHVWARRSGEAEYRRICIDDCDIRLAGGAYDLRVQNTDGSQRWDDDGLYEIARPSRVSALITSRRPARIAGGVLLAGGLATFAGLLGRGVALRADARDACKDLGERDCGDQTARVGRTQRIVGAVLGSLVTLIGALLVARRDRLVVEISEAKPDLAQSVAFEPEASAEPATAPETSGEAVRAVESVLREQTSALRACLGETPATVELRVAADGAVETLRVLGDLDETQRTCLSATLAPMRFTHSAGHAVSIDVQPALR